MSSRLSRVRPIRPAALAAVLVACCPPPTATTTTPDPVPDPVPVAPAEPDLRAPGETHLGSLTQLTFGGENAEAYWAFGGDRLIFQTTRPGIACDQIMVMDAARSAAEPTLVSTGKGRTTCSYFFPGDQEILYSSTHHVDAACPAPPDRSHGYVWGLYDFDIYKAQADGSNPTKLFGLPGFYDGEATVCAKDGSVVFTSDKDGDLELYRMDKDGKDVVRLTNTPGYDGGAFFNADCTKLVWRASRPTGEALADYQRLLKQHLVRPSKLEIWVADADGSNAQQVTYLDAASFAPYFHPSGTRILFSSNHGDPKGREFDIWAIDVDGTDLERITSSPGFDGFPMFSPDGKRLAFSSNRGSPPPAPGTHNSDTNVFVADWVEHEPRGVQAGAAERVLRAIEYLSSDAREGRGVGTAGLDDAVKWVEGELRDAGVEGGLAGGEFRQRFEVTTQIARGEVTRLSIGGNPVAPEAFTPSHVSANGKLAGKTVYAGYGIVDKKAKLDDYKGKRVRGKVVVVRRFTPASLEGKRRELGDLNYKAGLARKRGAIGLIVVDVPEGDKAESPLPSLRPRDGADAGIPIVVVNRAAGELLTKGSHVVDGEVELTPVKTPTDNVVGVIRAGAAARQPGALVIGAHLDHLGMGGQGTGALDADHAVHNGADDNASGIAAMLEAARVLSARKGELARDVYFVAFSAEELGLLGSHHFVKHAPYEGPAVAMLNMDMVGRMRENLLQVLGAESATEWASVMEPLCARARIACHFAGSGYGPSDHMAFYMGGSPVVHLFTGGHLQYHRVTDDAPLINAGGAARVAQLIADTTLALGAAPKLTYKKVAAPPKMGDIPMRGASLGTIPAYGDDGKIPGVLLSDVVPGGAAQKAGLEAGDRITKIGVTEVRNVQDLMLVLGEAVPGQEATILYLRDGKPQSTKAVFGTPRARH